MARTIIGELIVRLVDQVSGEAKKVAASLKDVERNAIGTGKGARGANDLASALKRAADNARNLARDGRGIDDWGSRFQRQIERLKLSGRDIDQVRSAWRRLQDDLRTGRLDEAFRTNAVQHWRNQTVAALAAVRGEAAQVKRAFGEVHAVISRLGHVVGLGAGAYGVGRVIRVEVRHAAELPREETRQYLGGMTPQEQATTAVKARELSGKYSSIGQVEIMEHVRQLRARFGDFNHALDSVEDVIRAQVVLQNLKGGGKNAGADLEHLVLGLETMGAGADPAKFRKYLDAFVRAKQLFPDLRGEDFRQYLQTAKSSKYALSDEYLATVVPTMMQHEGAAKFGTMQATAFGALVGLRSLPRSVEQLIKYGLAEEYHRDKQGRPYLDKMKDEAGFNADPFLWVRDVLQPALAAQGAKIGPDSTEKEKGEFVSVVTKMFGNRNAAEFFTALLVNQKVIEKDRAMLQNVRGLDAAEEVRKRDLFVAAEGVAQQFINVVQNALKPYGEQAIGVLNGVADALGRIAKALGENPELAKYVGGAGMVAGGAAGAGVSWLLGRKLVGWLGGGAGTAGAGAGVAGAGAGTSGLAGAARFVPWLAAVLGIATTPDILQNAPDGRSWPGLLKDRGWGKGSSAGQGKGTLDEFKALIQQGGTSSLGGALRTARIAEIEAAFKALEPALIDAGHTQAVAMMQGYLAALRQGGSEASQEAARIRQQLLELLNVTLTPKVDLSSLRGALEEIATVHRASYDGSSSAAPAGLGGGGGRFGGIPRSGGTGGGSAGPTLGDVMGDAANAARGRANFMRGQFGGPGRNLVTVSTDGGRRITVNREAAPAIRGFLSELESQNAPINSVGSYAHRNIAGSRRWSQHAFGNAIDINQHSRNVVGGGFRNWATRNADAVRAAERRWGMKSGGDWRNPDFGHWEWGGTKPWLDGARSQGGGVSAGEIYRVNEFRQEYFEPATDGVVLPTLPGGARGGDDRGARPMNFNQSMHFNLAGIQNADDFLKEVRARLAEETRSSLRGAFADYGVEV